MKKILITLCIIMLSFAMRAQEHMTFMGIPIDGKISAFVQKLEDKGFTYIRTREDGVACLTGSFAGKRDCRILVVSSIRSLTVWKVVVSFPSKSSWGSVKDEYQTVKSLYSRKYGEPEDVFEFFITPYYEGDGYEIGAISIGKAHYESFFKTNDGYIHLAIDAGEYRSGYVTVEYEDGINVKIKRQEEESSISEDI